ncbi:ankyrin repeat domain-containing protein [Marilutibacter chinensis]|uniref:Ankyrin repeat domain-containing protein n=1 Tax=Marilutibacter chinensis TaxID=2912247 RepID=A0ABS9HTJ5_9GAMM|nr:ankyrin repeat domain-containing protein [Lysobacter chinensis]MCF7222226.1 ankyrin repeat domain-containing protein [Lysobacter chinensis]
MKASAVAGNVAVLACSLLSSCAQPSQGASVHEVDWPVCNREQLLGHVPDRDAVQAHREIELPVLRYPFGTQRDRWGLQLRVRVDETGRVVCHEDKDESGMARPLSEVQRAGLKALRYRPFVLDGRPVAAIVTEEIAEEERPQRPVPMPQAPLERVRIGLERSACLGSCPMYRVEIRGDGQAVYEGRRFVAVEGRHAYRVPVEDVARLVESAREKALWSMRPAYLAEITDQPGYTVTLDVGGEVHRIEDYVGQKAGMPRVVSAFEDEIDAVARADGWVNLSGEAVKWLQEEGFDFESEAGAALLARAVERDGSSEGVVRLIELGTPIEGATRNTRFEGEFRPLMEMASRNGRLAVVEALIARGALETGGRVDQARIDAAFRAAIMGGRLDVVEAVWNASGPRRRPALEFDDVSPGEPTVRKRSPVTLLLSNDRYRKIPWQGREIAEWLAGKGCDLTAAAADGKTLLHIAAAANDARFVRYLLDRGLDASAPGTYGLPALAGTSDEDIALMLLEAGTDPAEVAGFSRYAEDRYWQRVLAWLDAHDNH